MSLAHALGLPLPNGRELLATAMECGLEEAPSDEEWDEDKDDPTAVLEALWDRSVRRWKNEVYEYKGVPGWKTAAYPPEAHANAEYLSLDDIEDLVASSREDKGSDGP